MLNPETIPATQLHRYLGAIPLDGCKVRFCVWSPTSDRVDVQLLDPNRIVPMRKSSGGYHMVEVDDVESGQQYWYRFHGTPLPLLRPDPASRSQPQGVHGPSAVVAGDRYQWADGDWTGIGRQDLVIYELHLGAFTARGTCAAAMDRLSELADLGVTAIEFMPVADYAGRWNWGYDGVCLFAPSHNYGTPDELRRLVDAAHGKGLAVILDVVYNHLGPEGNYLGQSGPYLSAHHTTPWGASPNFDDPLHGRELRRFFAANAIHWFDEYHIDALRVDAIHSMRDDSRRHVAAEISQAVKEWADQSQRPAMMIAESNVYDPEMLAPLSLGGLGFDAEWCDDFLHSVYAAARPGEQLCNRVYIPGSDLDQTLRCGYVYEGTLRTTPRRPSVTKRVDTAGLIYSIQTHDFIGNHPLGKRLHQLTSLDTQRAAAALLMLSPAIPMLFMGEEFACEKPFLFFVDFNDQHLRDAVVEGRESEYPQHDWTGMTLPTDPRAFQNSKIGPADQGDREMRSWYQSLIALRKNWRAAGLLSDANLSVQNDLDRGLYLLQYAFGNLRATVAVRLLPDSPLLPDSQTQSVCKLKAQGPLILDSRQGETGADEIGPNQAKVFFQQDETY